MPEAPFSGQMSGQAPAEMLEHAGPMVGNTSNDVLDEPPLDAEVVEIADEQPTAVGPYTPDVVEAAIVSPEDEAALAKQRELRDREDELEGQREQREREYARRRTLGTFAASGVLKDTPGAESFLDALASAVGSTAAPETPAPMSAKPEAPPTSPEQYAEASKLLATVLTNAKESPFPSPTAIKFLETALADMAAQSETGAKLAKDLRIINLTVKDLQKDAAAEGRDLTYDEIKKMYATIYEGAQQKGKPEKAKNIMRRKGLTWVLSNRGSVDLAALFSSYST